MNQTTDRWVGLFFVFGLRALRTPLFWWFNQQWQPSRNARIGVRYGRGGAQWIRTFCVAG
ncbi:hypothetical protein ACFRMN_19630 [Streptomyces sp. NPDC056835]|uniref:hypothetical protein n=1 Tax=Streptomyces sp. NPDC056835 TaxID=3345956 RepID=UPI00367942AC